MSMDLIAILRHVPHLLDACVRDETLALRSLRLVNKEASQVALLSLKSYTLTLNGDAKDTNVNGARLLSHTHLERMNVHLALSGTYSSNILLKAFVLEVGESLRTVTSLDLHLENTSGSAINTSLLYEALRVLVRRCPFLRFLHCQGQMTAAFMHTLGQVCPLISALSVVSGHEDTIEQLLLLQSVSFPRLDSVSFPNKGSVPNMSQFSSIVTLNLASLFVSANADLAVLPPKLQNLSLVELDSDPEAVVGVRVLLRSLRSLEFGSWEINLHALAELIRSTPALKVIKQLPCRGPFLKINCWGPSNPAAAMASDLSVLHDKLGVEMIKNAQFYFNPHGMEVGGLMQSFLASLPSMTGFTRLELAFCNKDMLVSFLKVFPDVVNLDLTALENMDDVGLQSLEACSQMTTLNIQGCQDFTMYGVFALCLRLPRLVRISCEDSEVFLRKNALKDCEEALRSQGLHVSISDSNWEVCIGNDKESEQDKLELSKARFKVVFHENIR